jgi:hypothetical protein
MSLDYVFPEYINFEGLHKDLKKNDLLMCKLITKDNKRYLDWMFIDYPGIGKSFSPYDLNIKKFMYFHGTTYVFKKKFILNNLFSNFLDNKQGEDVSWSLRIRKNSLVKLTKNLKLRVDRKERDHKSLTNNLFKNNNLKLNKKLKIDK